MTKQEALDKCNEIYKHIEDIHSMARDLLDEIESLERESGYLPSELSDFDDETKESENEVEK